MTRKEICDFINRELTVATGCTEPAAVALTAATAREYMCAPIEKIEIHASSNMIKNVMAVHIPGIKSAGIEYAAALGVAFQITNFLRDVGEDLDRGRIYLPTDELASFGVDRELLGWCRSTGAADPRVRRALAYLVARTRAIYRRAAPGIPMLAPVSRACVATAFCLYGGILDEIEAAGYHILARRVEVPSHRRLAVALPGLSRALLARARHRPKTLRTVPA